MELLFTTFVPVKLKYSNQKPITMNYKTNAGYRNISCTDYSHMVWTLITEWWLTLNQNKNMSIRQQNMKIKNNLIGSEPIGKGFCNIRFKGRFTNITILSAHAMTRAKIKWRKNRHAMVRD